MAGLEITGACVANCHIDLPLVFTAWSRLSSAPKNTTSLMAAGDETSPQKVFPPVQVDTVSVQA